MKNNNVTDIAIKRKNRSIDILKKDHIPYLEQLPAIEDETQVKMRSVEEIANRAICLAIVAVKGEGLEQQKINEIITEYQIKNEFSPKELEFINNENPTQKDKIQFSWRYECYWVLLWALGYIEELEYPNKICDVSKSVEILVNRGKEQFIRDSKLKSISEILDEADLIYRYHWAIVDSRLKSDQPPGNLNSDVIMERHHTLNWLTRYMDADWDTISTDT